MTPEQEPLEVPSRFVISSLPRTGSTTMMRILNRYPGIRCLIEPFHPNRYGGKLNEAARRSPEAAFAYIWKNWNGTKHVWEANGWPFLGQEGFNHRVVAAAGVKVIVLIRRNAFRRIVSNIICRQTRFWIGTRQEFHERLDRTALNAIDPAEVRSQLSRDNSAMSAHLDYLRERGADVQLVYYEDFFDPAEEFGIRLAALNSLLCFIRRAPVTMPVSREHWLSTLRTEMFLWASPEVYRRIPGVDLLEEAVGCDATGWLFH